jgi:hypothetical protein
MASARAARLVVGALALALAGEAGAVPKTLALTGGLPFPLGSGAALGTAAGAYGAGTALPVEVGVVAAAGAFPMELRSFFVPKVPLAFGEHFAFEILANGLPTDAFTLSLDAASGAINPGLSDPPLQVRITRFSDGAPAGSEVVALELTTGTVQLPACGAVPSLSLAGTPVQAGSGALALVGGLCLEEFAGGSFETIFQLRLHGTLSCAPRDREGDGVLDEADNCVGVANGSQLDTDGDGFGNACDADYNGDGIVGAPDLGALGRAFGATRADPRYHPDLDSDGDGVIGSSELLVLARSFLKAPGPAGSACE